MISVKAVAYEKDLYTLSHLENSTSTILEDVLLKRIDQSGSIVLQTILESNGNKLSEKAKFQWACFMLSLNHRHPERLSRLRSNWDASCRQCFNELVKSGKTEADDNLDDIYADRGFGLLFNKISTSSHVINHLTGMVWSTFTSDDSCYTFLTGDAPLLRTNDLRSVDAHLVMPISPHTVFMAANDSAVIQNIQRQSPRKIVTLVNNGICRSATRFIFSNTNSQKCFIDKRFIINKRAMTNRLS